MPGYLDESGVKPNHVKYHGYPGMTNRQKVAAPHGKDYEKITEPHRTVTRAILVVLERVL